MTVPTGSQSDPLPRDLPFKIISKTIGQGAYASVRKACPLSAPRPVIAVKFIHKQHALGLGRLSRKQLEMECKLHGDVGKHQNIVQFIGAGEDKIWMWVAMELADGGDLFDKIEADEGVGQDIAHLYFRQLISAVSYMHDKGIAHRDIKPENILLSGAGDLKIADFGLAALFRYNGVTRKATTVCGSPPYIAPEIVNAFDKRKRRVGSEEAGYVVSKVDIWACGIVLFVLLAGNTPWDEPTAQSWEFKEYIDTDGHSSDELWEKVPTDALSLLRGILKVDPEIRFTLENIRKHPWFTRSNPHIGANGLAANPMGLATQMLESLRIDWNPKPTSSQLFLPHRCGIKTSDAMDVDVPPSRFASTQPDIPMADMMVDWERPAVITANAGLSASQPATVSNASTSSDRPGSRNRNNYANIHDMIHSQLSEDPSMSQFTATPSVPLSLTQAARHFRDIIPSHSLTRFLSPRSFSLLLPLLSEALHCLGVPVPPFPESALDGRERDVVIRLKTLDRRRCPLVGTVNVERYFMGDEEGADGSVLSVRFLKMKGDPVEWRRLFKKVVVLCREAVLVPGA